MTWNINSVRLRKNLVARVLRTYEPDVLCLQEIKCPTALFPKEPFQKLGYAHIAVNGQKGYHGVATLSRHEFADQEVLDFCNKGDTRHIAVSIRPNNAQPMRIDNVYVPSGGDVPDRTENEKFDHKLRFLDEMGVLMQRKSAGGRTVLTGDLNVAPLETDVWSHKALLKVVSHTPVEVAALAKVREAGKWVDAVRHVIDPNERLYTWWSYRSPDWKKADKGRRLDHIWVTPDLTGSIKQAEVYKRIRGWQKTSDHVPVMLHLGI